LYSLFYLSRPFTKIGHSYALTLFFRIRNEHKNICQFIKGLNSVSYDRLDGELPKFGMTYWYEYQTSSSKSTNSEGWMDAATPKTLHQIRNLTVAIDRKIFTLQRLN
jgi:hypothetical protein